MNLVARLDAFDQWCLRRILGITWQDYITNVECHHRRMLTKPSTKTFLLTGGDDLVDIDSPGWLQYTVIYGSLTSAWTTFLYLLLTVYYGGGWFVALRTTLVHATDDDDEIRCKMNDLQ